MRATLKAVWSAVQGSFWITPVAIALAALLAARLVIAADQVSLFSALARSGFYPNFGPEGARTILSTIAGGTMSMASLVFSLTFVGLTLLSGQLGPRLLMLFMHDTTTQIMMGIFVGVFLFALSTLSFVSELEQGFVPNLAVAASIVFATLAFGLIIYFVHHMATKIQADQVVADLGARFDSAVARVTAAARHDDPAKARTLSAMLDQTGPYPVPAPASGYVRHVDYAALVAAAQAQGLTLHLEVRSDDYIARGLPLMTVSGAEPDLETLSDAFQLGPRRDVLQEASYEARALVEIALRALSPGIHDPNTAVAAIDHLSAGLVELARGPEVPRILFDSRGVPRIVRPDLGFSYYVRQVVAPLLPVLRSDLLANERLVVMLATLERVAHRDDDIAEVRAWLAVARKEVAHNALPDAFKQRLLDLCEGRPATAHYPLERG